MGESVLKKNEREDLDKLVDIAIDIEPDVTAYSCEGEKVRPFDPSKIDIIVFCRLLVEVLKAKECWIESLFSDMFPFVI